MMCDRKENINEIRTERLSRALQALDNARKISTCSRKNSIDRTSDDNDSENDDSTFPAYSKRILIPTRSASASYRNSYRRRTSSVPERIDFSTRHASTVNREFDGHPSSTPSSGRHGFALNRFVRHFFQRFDSDEHIDEENKPKNIAETLFNNNETKKFNTPSSARKTAQMRQRTMTAHEKAGNAPLSASVCAPVVRARCHTQSASAASANVCAQQKTALSSKNSSNLSSRCPSPSPLLAPPSFNHSISAPPLSEPVSPVSPSTIYPENRFTVLVVGAKGVGKTILIDRFLENSNGIDATDDKSVRLNVNGYGETYLRFIEVNNQKNDLWLTLCCVAYVILYNFDEAASFRNAADVVKKLREQNDTASKPIMLVANKTPKDRKRFVITNDDGRHISKQYNCKFHEIYMSAGRSVPELLTTVGTEVNRHYRQVYEALGKRNGDYEFNSFPTCGSIFHVRTWSAGSTSSSASRASSSSITSLRHRLFSKRNVKETNSNSNAASCTNLTLINLHNRLYEGGRRGSRSLENLASYQAFAKRHQRD